MAPQRIPRLQVIIDYRDLVKLLNAADEVDDLKKDIKRLKDQLGALRGIQNETIEKIGEIQAQL